MRRDLTAMCYCRLTAGLRLRVYSILIFEGIYAYCILNQGPYEVRMNPSHSCAIPHTRHNVGHSHPSAIQHSECGGASLQHACPRSHRKHIPCRCICKPTFISSGTGTERLCESSSSYFSSSTRSMIATTANAASFKVKQSSTKKVKSSPASYDNSSALTTGGF